MTEPGGQQHVDELQVLCEQAAALVRNLPDPVQRISIRRGDCAVEVEWPAQRAAAAVSAGSMSSSAVDRTEVSDSSSAGQPEAAETGHIVRAPLVGTFYRSPEPGAPPFVSIGDVVEVGQPVAIVEAMKLMNTITADVAGRIVEIYVDNDQPVEFEQPLLRIVPAMHVAPGDAQRAA